MASDNQLFRWCFTLFNDKVTAKQLCVFLPQIANKWAFQQEKTAEGKLHWQGMLNLIKRKRLSEVIALCSDSCFVGCHWSAMAGATKTFNYVMKLETRVSGPYSDQLPVPEDMPFQLDDIKELRPWQQSIVDNMELQKDPKTADRRCVNILYSKTGNIGGTLLKGWLRWNRKCTVVPTFMDMQDMAAMVMCKPPDTAYFLDMPRNMPKSKLTGFWNGIEMLKDGYCYDKRHKFRDRQFGIPCVWVKTNEVPNLEMLSADRWRIWCVDENLNLVKFKL